MDLKIKDVADLLNVSEATVSHWLTHRKIPFYKIDNQYFFNRTQIEAWVMGQKQTQETSSFRERKKQTTSIDPEEKAAPHHAGRKQYSLYRALHKGLVLNDVSGKTKEDIIRQCMQRCAKDLDLDAEVITELLLDREKLQATALNNGVGVPHTRECILSPGQNVVTVVFPESPIPYGALDGESVHTLFFLFASDDKRHLHLLAKIAHLSSQKAMIDLLKTKPTKHQLLEYIRDWESRIQKA